MRTATKRASWRTPAVLFLLALLFILASAISGCGSRKSDALKIGIIPYDAPNKLETEYTPFANYIAASTGRKAQVFVAMDYTGVAQALQSDQIDCAYLNPLSYVLFDNRMKDTPEHLIPLAMPEVQGSLYYYGVIVVRKDSGITNVAQLKGKKFAFAEPTSTSGYLYPYEYMKQHGLDPDKDLKEKIFAGDATVIPSVLNGTVDAGAVFAEGVTMFASPAQQKTLRVIATVGPIANGMFVVRGNLDPKVVSKIRQAFSTINTDAAAKPALKALQVTRWDSANDSVFDPVRKAATVLGLNLESLKK